MDELLTVAEVAEVLGVSAGTWRAYVKRGSAPAADDPGDVSAPVNRRTPRWRRSSVERYRMLRKRVRLVPRPPRG